MDTVTYPHHAVQNELEHWLKKKVDVTRWAGVAKRFDVTAIPVAVLVSPDGTVFGRIANFVKPVKFAAQLDNARRAAKEE